MFSKSAKVQIPMNFDESTLKKIQQPQAGSQENHNKSSSLKQAPAVRIFYHFYKVSKLLKLSAGTLLY